MLTIVVENFYIVLLVCVFFLFVLRTAPCLKQSTRRIGGADTCLSITRMNIRSVSKVCCARWQCTSACRVGLFFHLTVGFSQDFRFYFVGSCLAIVLFQLFLNENDHQWLIGFACHSKLLWAKHIAQLIRSWIFIDAFGSKFYQQENKHQLQEQQTQT